MSSEQDCRILVVESKGEAGIANTLSSAFGGAKSAATLRDAEKRIRRSDCDVVILDLAVAAAEDALERMETWKEACPWLRIIVVSGGGDSGAVRAALEAGADGFFAKPLAIDDLEAVIRHDHRLIVCHKDILHREERERMAGMRNGFVVRSARMEAVVGLAMRYAGSRRNVMLYGETGVGKREIARFIHNHSPYGAKPFLTVHCGLFSSRGELRNELFGHEKGSYTSAHERTEGAFQRVQGGTIFLDEFGKLEPDLQQGLLLAVDEKMIHPYGRNCAITVDFRLICAANENLHRLAEAGAFRPDLLNRVEQLPLVIPPLRERKEEIEALANHFIAKECREEGMPVKRLSPGALKLLKNHDWENGNVRELQNMVIRAVVLAGKREKLGPGHFPGLDTPRRTIKRPGEKDLQRYFRILETHRWNVTRAAEELGQKAQTFRDRLIRWGLYEDVRRKWRKG